MQADLDLIEREMDRIGDVALFSIDPLSSYLGKATTTLTFEQCWNCLPKWRLVDA